MEHTKEDIKIAKLERKLATICKLTNTLQEIESPKIKNDIAYLMYRIIEDEEVGENEVATYRLMGKADMFMEVEEN